MEKRSRLKSYFLAILTSVVLIFSGCSDEFFTEKAGDRITPEQHYASVVDLDIAAYGAIIPLQDIMPRLIMLDGLRSDMMDVTPFADAYLNEINDQMISAGNPYTDPSDLYKIIININEVLANIPVVIKNDKQADSLTVSAYTNALIGMRSWTYLTISRLYGKAAIIPDNMIELPANLNQSVMTKAVLIDTLINQVLPYIHDNSTGTVYAEARFGGMVNTKALLGELYLEKGDYTNAVKYLKMACESYDNLAARLKVDKTYKDIAWINIFYNAEGQDIENLCVVPYSSDEGQSNPLPSWTYNQYLVKPTQVVIDSFSSQISATGTVGDAYRGMGYTFYADTSVLGDGSTVIYPIITKYLIPLLESFSSDIIISRAADIHLLLAEAYNRLGDATSQKYALMLLNDGVNKENPKPAPYTRWAGNLGIRGRVTLQARTVPATMTDPEAITNLIEDFIIAERAMELAYEGKRWNDLVRIAERRNTPEYLADKIAAKFPLGTKRDGIRALLMDPSKWYLQMQ